MLSANDGNLLRVKILEPISKSNRKSTYIFNDNVAKQIACNIFIFIRRSECGGHSSRAVWFAFIGWLVGVTLLTINKSTTLSKTVTLSPVKVKNSGPYPSTNQVKAC